LLVVSDITAAYLRWAFTRAALARGYWTVTAVYLVVVADLSPFQLVLIGTMQSLTVLVAEVPAGVFADTVSRRSALVLAHGITGVGMATAGMTTSFPLLVLTQSLWGLGWAFASGADVAWITDELAAPQRSDRVLAAQARWGLLGSPAGVALLGALAWATTLRTAIVTSGLAMVLLGAFVARWPETNFVPADAGRRWHEAMARFRRGFRLARLDRVILGVMVATALINGGAQLYGRLLEFRLIGLGLPTAPDPIVWFALLSLASVVTGASVLRIIEARIHGAGVATRAYVLASVGGAAGMALFAHAPDIRFAVLGVLLFSGIAEPVTRATATIAVNRRTASDVRATVHSFLSQAENAGELVFGLALAAVVAAATTTTALVCAALLVVAAGVVVFSSSGEA
jgi:MFS family permease